MRERRRRNGARCWFSSATPVGGVFTLVGTSGAALEVGVTGGCFVGASLSYWSNLSSKYGWTCERSLPTPLIRGVQAILAVGALAAAVLLLYGLLGLPAPLAIIFGALASGVVSRVIRSHMPEAPPWSDGDRVNLPKLRPVWLLAGGFAVAALRYGASIPFVVALPLTVTSIGAFVLAELRARRQAELRLGGEATGQEEALSSR
jgi:hypothetical protein